MMKKVKTEDIAIEVIELAEQEFSPSEVYLETVKNIFSQVQYGKIVLNVIDGKIESMRIIKNYKVVEPEI